MEAFLPLIRWPGWAFWLSVDVMELKLEQSEFTRSKLELVLEFKFQVT